MKFPNSKSFAVFTGVISVYLFLSYAIFEVYSSWKMQNGTTNVDLPYVVVHIDLKGSPPKLTYLSYLLEMFRDNGVNALLMEYEDMFPYEGKLVNLSAKNCYTRTQLKEFITRSALLQIEIIPLVQTFGHLEYALKLQEFRHLREDPGYPDSICPSNVESRAMVEEMLKQVVNFHNEVKYLKHIHVGCDEVFQMNKCSLCKKTGLTNTALYINHVRYIADVITKISPDTTVLIWDDMLRTINPAVWTKIDCFSNIEPVYWAYSTNFNNFHTSLNKYHKKFKNIWSASAFKGADGSTSTIPNLYNRVMNHFKWMQLLQDYKLAGETKRFQFKGIILTGWSRYSHFQPLCELLPASIPSLIFNLRMIQRYKFGGIRRNLELEEFFDRYLSIEDKYLECNIDIKTLHLFMSCHFEGDKLYSDLMYYINLMNKTYSYMHNDNMLLSADEFYSKSNYVSLSNLDEKIEFYDGILNKIKDLKKAIAISMNKYFEGYVVNEYIGYKFYGITKELTNNLEILQQLSRSGRVWERGNPFLAFNVTIQ